MKRALSLDGPLVPEPPTAPRRAEIIAHAAIAEAFAAGRARSRDMVEITAFGDAMQTFIDVVTGEIRHVPHEEPL